MLSLSTQLGLMAKMHLAGESLEKDCVAFSCTQVSTDTYLSLQAEVMQMHRCAGEGVSEEKRCEEKREPKIEGENNISG